MDALDFDRQLQTLLTGTANQQLDMAERLQELGRRMVDQNIATSRVLEMLTPLEPLPQPLPDGHGVTGNGAPAQPQSIPAPSIPPWGDARENGRPNFAWPSNDQDDDPLPRVAQAVATERGRRA